VCGTGGSERDNWTTTARTTFRDSYIYNDVKNTMDLANVLAAFPEGSIAKVVISGHGTAAGAVGIQATNNDTIKPAGYKPINSNTLDTLARRYSTKSAAMIKALKADALVEIQSCNWTTNERDLSAAGTKLANGFKRRVRYVVGSIDDWNATPTSVTTDGKTIEGRWATASPSNP
jgi:hypothetical protein